MSPETIRLKIQKTYFFRSILKCVSIVSFCLVHLLVLSSFSLAGDKERLTVAAASNFIRPMDEISQLFTEESGIEIETVYSSTGKLYAQIKNGAPYDLFFSADSERPRLLYNGGLAGEPFVYATGEVVLWSRDVDITDETAWQDVIRNSTPGPIAIASPKVAPYGEVVAAALKKTVLWDMIEQRLVYGQNVAQVFQYAHQGVAVFAFIPLSYAISEEGSIGRYWKMPEAAEVLQEAVILNRVTNKSSAEAFLRFVRSERVKRIITAHGYR